jgi:hypothetical protein
MKFNKVANKKNQDAAKNGNDDVPYWPLIPGMGAIAGALVWYYIIGPYIE